MGSTFYERFSSYTLKLHCQAAAAGRIMRGKALLSPQECEMTFIENPPHGPRSVEVGRTRSSRFVRRPDGLYTVTFRFNAAMPRLKENAVAEMRQVAKMIAEDYKSCCDTDNKSKM